jgi:hypothetical protein
MVYSYLFPFCYLEHLDSRRLGHAKRLMSWNLELSRPCVGLYTDGLTLHIIGYPNHDNSH